MALFDHPARRFINTEMRLRQMPPVHPPSSLIQILRLVAPEDREAESAYIDQLPVAHVDRRRSDRHCHLTLADGRIVLWERHSEASTMTLYTPPAAEDGVSSISNAAQDTLFDWLMHAPGQVLRASRVAVVPDTAAAKAFATELHLDAEDLLIVTTAGGSELWSDFRVQADGFGRLIIAANGAHSADLGRIVQQMQELGNYRHLALLGLQEAQARSGTLTRLEAELLSASNDFEGDGESVLLLDRLIALAGSASALASETSWRMSATAAYTNIALQRLNALQSRPQPGHQSLDEFIERRLLPAARTCEAFDRRVERLATRIERVTSQLRTRVDIGIQRQNGAMLSSMQSSALQQLRLQRMVEGLSVFALSYYAIGLIAYAAKAIETRWPALDAPLVTGASVLPMLILVALFLRWRSRR